MDTIVGSAGKEQKLLSRETSAVERIGGIARDLLYAEPELGAGHSHPSLSTVLLTSISSCIRPRSMPSGQSCVVQGSSCSH